MPDSFFITTAIDYTNGAPHLGHAYEKVLADVLARFHRLIGEDVFFLSGVDQHGQKVQQSAEKQGVPPQEFVDTITAQFQALWKRLDVRYDAWAATTAATHKECVGKILTRLWDQGHLYKDKRAGYYSVRQEQFLTDKERGPDGEFGPEWGEVVLLEEENYYFKLARHRDWLLNLIDNQPEFITPAFRRAELRNAAEKLNGDLCVSRPKSRLSWGIEFPFDPDYVTYVWFDALVNYISFAGYDPSAGEQPPVFRNRWPALHVIGKDILIPAHGIYWPIMLHALGFEDDEMPRLLVHGWWNSSGSKMSKSLGNIIDPAELASRYGAEALRYYLMSDIATGRDADFSEERLVQRFNNDLANNLGNLLNRTLNMAWKYRDGRIIPGDRNALAAKEGAGPLLDVAACVEASLDAYASHRPNAALEATLSIVSQCNQLIDLLKPWAMAKVPEDAAVLDALLHHLVKEIHCVAILISPVLSDAAHKILDQLGWHTSQSGNQERFALTSLESAAFADHQLDKPFPLFPRIEPA
jgi:methionyl-tRNA synthetase